MLLKLLPLLLDTQMGLRLLPEGSREQLLHNCLVICFLRCCTANSSSPLTRPCSEAASALLPNPSRSSWGGAETRHRYNGPDKRASSYSSSESALSPALSLESTALQCGLPDSRASPSCDMLRGYDQCGDLHRAPCGFRRSCSSDQALRSCIEEAI